MNNTPVILVWDTNAVDCIVRGIEFLIRNALYPGTEFERHQEFLTLFELVFDQLRASLDHVSHTSDRVFSEEIDPRLVGCHLRNGKALIEAYCNDVAFVGQWSASIEHRMPSEEVAEEQIALFQGLTEIDLGGKDLSLIVAALKLANQIGRDAVVVTDDQALAEEIWRLRRTHVNVELDGLICSTSRITTMFSIEILRLLHNSCGIDNRMWWNIIISFLQHHGQRALNAAREKERKAFACIEGYRKDCDTKAELAVRREMEQLFGGFDA
jgi:hypothetical protein